MKRNQLIFVGIVSFLYGMFIAMSLLGGWSMPGMTGWWGFGSISRIAIFFMWLAPFALLMAFVLFAMWLGKKERIDTKGLNCGECNRPVDPADDYCRHCGASLG